jgi:hypothetical protein
MALGGEETDDPAQSGLGGIAFLQQSGNERDRRGDRTRKQNRGKC